MDLKTALKDILPSLHLKVRKKPGEKWIIDRPVEFHQCDTCDTMVDQRIIDVMCITCTDDYAIVQTKRFASWCALHNDPSVIAACSAAKPCRRCYRWTLTHHKSKVCSQCTRNPWTEMPPPMIAKRPWYAVAPVIEMEPDEV